jgi:hypothetical protein
MPFLRFSRDKRGYEHFYIVQPAGRTAGARAAGRVLYWFRTPPNVKVGRDPFDPAIRRALERQNPGVHFDWTALLSTPIPPPPEAERWRERRRVARAAREFAAEEAAAEEAAEQPPGEEAAGEALEAAGADVLSPEPAGALPAEPEPAGGGAGPPQAATVKEAGPPQAATVKEEGETRRPARRRRRRRRRGGGGAPQPPAAEV